MNEVQQGPIQTNAERLARLPDVLRGYAKDIDEHGAPLDSGLPDILRFIAGQIASVNHADKLAEALRGLMSNDFANGTISKRDAYRASALEALRQWSLANREVTQ